MGHSGFVFEQQSLVFSNARERSAIRHGAGHVDDLSPLIPDVMLRGLGVQRFVDMLSALGNPIPLALSTNDVEALECEARRIDLAMAPIAARITAMLFQLLSNGRGAPDIRLDGRHRRRRR